MNTKFQQAVQAAVATHRKKQIRYRILTILSAIVVFCTTYALILPAITMNAKEQLICSTEELSHHAHSEECWDSEGDLICGYADFVIHEHTQNCFDKDGDLICSLPEILEHRHNASCFAIEEQNSDENEFNIDIEDSDDVATPANATPNTDEIYDIYCDTDPLINKDIEAQSPELICSEDEIYPHQHTVKCFDEDGNWICGKLQIYEHQHTDACFERVDVLTDEPIPSDPGADINDDSKIRSMTHFGEDYSVSVSFTDEAQLPENVVLQVEEILPEHPAYEGYFQQTNECLSEEQQGLVFCRFFDVSFLSEGVEIEPAASVEVQVAYAESLPQDEDSLCSAVHFAEEGIEVLPAEIKVTEDGEDAFVFSQNSFSVVGTAISALNLSEGSYIFYKDGYAIGAGYSDLMPVAVTVDENGYVYPTNSAIPIDAIIWTYSGGTLKSASTNYYTYISLTSSGAALTAYASSTMNARILNNAVRFSSTVSSGYGYGSTTYYLGFDGSNYTSKDLFANGDYFLAAKIATVDDTVIQPGDLEIEDKIKQDGCLYPKLNITGVDSDTKLTYKWYRSNDNGNSWEMVERTKVTGDSYNVAKDGSWLNVALDKGANCEYKVALVAINGTQYGPISSNDYHVPYFDSIQNGDFEEPVISTDVSNDEHYQPLLPNGTAGLVWKTTAGDGEIELISVASTAFKTMSTKWHNCESAAKGVQYAELNAGMAGALYQDVLTTPDSTMYWSLAHRGRGKSGAQGNTWVPNSAMEDTMYVVIMSTALAEQYDITTQTKVNDVINNTNKYPGADVVKITDDAVKWYYHTGKYSVPDGQYLTRYFFVAGETYFDTSGDTSALPYTVGNHLDDIYFSTELPPPTNGFGNLVIEKNIVGLEESAAKELLEQLKFYVSTSQTPLSGSAFSNFSRNADGSFTVSYQQTIALGTSESVYMQIREDLGSAAIEGYDRTETTVRINSEIASENYSGAELNLLVANKDTTTVSFTNTYQPQMISLNLLKTDENGKPIADVAFSLEMQSDDTWTSVYETILVDEDGKVTIPKLYYDKVYRITETEAPDGYYMLTAPVYFKIVLEGGISKLYPCDTSGAVITSWPTQVSVLTGDAFGLQIINLQGMILPETGGSGIYKIYFLGISLVCISAFFTGYVRRNKKKGGSN